MIEQIERKDVFKQHSNSALEISQIQRAIYSEDDLNTCENEAERNEYLSAFDTLHELGRSNKTFNTIISFDHSDLETYPEKLSKKLITLFSDLNTNKLLIITHLKINLFGNLNTQHPHLKQVYKDLKQLIGNDRYDEALKIGIQDLERLIPIVFWMQRIDTLSPEFLFFHDEQNRFSFYICKYGKVHLTAFETELFTSEILEKNDWKEIDECLNSLT
nr:hypothetical protein [uncultured Fluviicola sp.]